MFSAFLLGWKRNRFILNPLSIFSAIWMVVVLCAFTHGKLNRPQDDTVVILIVGTLAFSIEVYSPKIQKKRRVYIFKNLKTTNDGTKYCLRYNIIYILSVICIFAYLYNLFALIKLVGSGNLGLIKLYLQSNENGRSSWLNAFYYLLVDPLTVAIPICAISDFIFERKIKNYLSLLLC